MIPQNRIRDCWDLIPQGSTEYIASCTPICAAVAVAREDRQRTGKWFIIIPMPERN